MTGQVEILCGHAGSGKTARLLDLFRQELRRLAANATPGQAVWITPTNRSRRAVLRQLLDGSLTVCFAPNVLTFDAFAERLMRTTTQEITPLSDVARRMIATSVIEGARGDGSLRYYEPIAHTSGFLDLFLGLIAELKRDETWPNEFEANCRKRGARRPDIELALLYARYQERLNTLKLYDAEGRFWSARQILADGNRGAFEQLSLVIVDGFADFTYPQYEIVHHLGTFAERTFISLPLENPLVRTDLFAKSAVALAQLNQRCSPKSPRSAAAAKQKPGAKWNGLQQIAAHLFRNPRETPRSANAEGLEIIEAAGAVGEARGIAERIKALLIGGVAADQIVVALRGSDDAELFASTFAAAGIPCWCEKPTRLCETPLAKALVSLLNVELEDWSFERLAAVLRSTYFRPRWRSFDDRSAADTAIRVLRKLRLSGGRERILSRLADVKTAAPETTDASAETEDGLPGPEKRPSAAALATAHRLLDDFAAATERLSGAHDFPEWINRVVGLTDELGLSPRKAPESTSPEARLDLRDWIHGESLKNILYEAAGTCALLDDHRQLTLPEFAQRLRDVLDSQSLAPRETGTANVLILDAPEVRNLDIAYLFLAGLSESSFPRSRLDDCFYTEAERRQLVRKTLTGSVPSTQQQEEMLLFYSIVTRARTRLTLSYPSMSRTGQPLFPSPYVTAIRDLFIPESLLIASQNDLDPVLPRERALTASDLRLVATEEVRETGAGLFRALADRAEWGPAARGILASARMAESRFEQKGFTPFEGMLSRSANRQRLAQRYPSEYQFSTTQLEAYASCPFRFLLGHVLRIEQVESVEEIIDARERGKILHDILARLHGKTAEDPRRKSRQAMPLARSLQDLIDEHLPIPATRSPFDAALIAAERHFVGLFAELYAEQWDAYCQSLAESWESPPEPAFVELAFGDAPNLSSAESADQSKAAFVTFGEGAAEVRVRGRIDRVDVGRRQGQTVFNIIDYKTREGRRFKVEDIQRGLSLQLAIYVSAIVRGGVLGTGASPHQMLYWNLTRSGHVPGLKGSKAKVLESIDLETASAVEQSLHKIVPLLVSRLRQGEFPVYNLDADCTRFCPYSTVCRVNQMRDVADERGKHWDLSRS